MAFEAFRKNGGPTYYDEVHIPWEGDLIVCGLIFCFCILALSFYLILPGFRGKDKLFSFLRITISLFIGTVILVTNFAQTWEVAETTTRTKYKAGIGHDVNVTIGVNIGLRGVNITMKGDKDQIPGETIDYNEKFSWDPDFLQGRIGFGPFAGEINQQYRAAQFRGLPLPILWAAEYFTIDGEGIRWGRLYRQAGWFSHIMLWLAFPLWVMANILFFVLLRYGAYFLAMTGLSMVTANIIWGTLRNPTQLKIPYTSHDQLEFSYGASFWLCLITGILCVILGIAVFLLDKLCPTQIAAFFGVDVLQDSEAILIEEAEEPIVKDDKRKENGDGDGNRAGPSNQDNDGEEEEEDDDDALYLPPPPKQEEIPSTSDRARPYIMKPQGQARSFRTAEHRITKRLQRPRRRDPPPRPPRQNSEEDPYNNVRAQADMRPKAQAAPTVSFGNRKSLAEDDLYENPQQAVEMTNFEPHDEK